MNTLILTDKQLANPQNIPLSERQTKHITSIIKAQTGDILSVGRLNGNLGKANVYQTEEHLCLKLIHLDTPPPPQLDFKLILALPRPQMIKRILQTIATFGISELILIHTARVEKSFWQSPSVTNQSIQEHFILGLEQAKATQLPHVKKYTRFREFIEDHCSQLTQGFTKYVAHPGAFPMCESHKKNEKIALAIGPEGGFSEFEVKKFTETGFQPIQLGERILKVETAVTALLGRLM